MTLPYVFLPQLVVRRPALPLQPGAAHRSMDDYWSDERFKEALYLASPALFYELQKYAKGQLTDEKTAAKLRRSLAKYFLRMSNRSTPFGLFSGCTTGHWSGSTRLLAAPSAQQRHTRLDMHYLCALAQEVSRMPSVASHLRYFPNTSLYAIGDELRYVEYRYQQGRRHHTIASVAKIPALEDLLAKAKKGLHVNALTECLADDEVTPEEAQGFVAELIAEQVLVSQLEPSITGTDVLSYLVDTIKAIPQPHDPTLHTLCTSLAIVQHELRRLDGNAVNAPERYQSILQTLRRLPVPVDEAKLFQSDSFFPADQVCLDASLQEELRKGIQVLARLTPPAAGGNLESFIRRFTDRYEDSEVPLLEALDVEAGIGYIEHHKGDIVPLIQDLVLPSRKSGDFQASIGIREQFLLKKLEAWMTNGEASIRLTDDDLPTAPGGQLPLPPSAAVMFRLFDSGRIYLESFGGSSAANLLGRFAHGSEPIRKLVREICAAEQAQNPGVLFAEIVHLPESRVGNILLHPPFREYEIPFLSRSSVDAENQIPLDDLLISVRNRQIILRSRRLNKLVIPRLSSAHNFKSQALPVYQFLCELQTQGLCPGLGFHWGVLEGTYAHLPRVEYGSTVLCPAQWNLTQKHLAELLNAPEKERGAALDKLRKAVRLPAQFVLADGDNELLIDVRDPLSVSIWLDAIRDRQRFTLKESLLTPNDAPVRDAAGRGYGNQFVCILLREEATYRAALPLAAKSLNVTRSFLPGSEWLYVKLYCGAKSADKMLSEAVAPALGEFDEKGWVGQFFFVRYADPAFHLRLRFRLTSPDRLGPVMHSLHKRLFSEGIAGLLWKVQTDTYHRELERYGPATITHAEALFDSQSRAVLALLQSGTGAVEPVRWLWIVKAIDRLLDEFGFGLSEKLDFLSSIKTAFHQEYRADTVLLNQLTALYRHHRKAIEQALSAATSAELQPLVAILETPSSRHSAVVADLLDRRLKGTLEVPLHDLLASYVHMLVNRVVSSDPRTYELVLYDLLFTYYRSQTERSKRLAAISNPNCLSHA